MIKNVFGAAIIISVLALKPAGYLLKTIDKDGLNKALDEFFAKQKVAKV